MGFRRVPRGDHIVTSLVISDVREHHYGSYYVETEVDGCKSTIKFDVKHLSGEFLHIQFVFEFRICELS